MVQTHRMLPAHCLPYKVLAATYTVLLGFILPFICWGAMATPGHPHQVAHIVFLLPPEREPMATQVAVIDHSAHLHHASDLDAEQPDPAAQPVGRSVPDQLSSAISIISPLFVVQVLLAFLLARFVLRMTQSEVTHLFDPRVLTPPPRCIYL